MMGTYKCCKPVKVMIIPWISPKKIKESGLLKVDKEYERFEKGFNSKHLTSEPMYFFLIKASQFFFFFHLTGFTIYHFTFH